MANNGDNPRKRKRTLHIDDLLDEEDQTTGLQLSQAIANMPGQPPDQQRYNTVMYNTLAQRQSQSQNLSQSNVGPRLQNQYAPNLQPNSMAPRNPNSYPNMTDRPGNHYGPSSFTPTLFTPGTQGSSMNGYGNTFWQTPNQYQSPDSAARYRHDVQGSGNPPQIPSSYQSQPTPNPQRPNQLQLQQPQPLIGFPQGQGRGYLNGSTSGPLDPNIYRDFPAPARHERLDVNDLDEMPRQLLYYVDYSGQRPGESWTDYRERTLRCRLNIGLESRQRPPIPPGLTKQQRRHYRVPTMLAEEDHREKLDPNDEAYDEEYAINFRADRAAAQARNAQRRAAAVVRLRCEYEAAGYPNFPDPPDPEDSGDELHTHDQDGPLNGRSDGPPQDGANSQRNNPPPSSGSNVPPGGNNRPPKRGNNRPSSAGGLGGQGRGQGRAEEISLLRCKKCAIRKTKCSLPETGKPCGRCRRLKVQCEDLIVKVRGVEKGTKRGKYNMTKDKTKSKQPKKKPKSKKTGDVDEEEEEEQGETEDDEEERGWNGNRRNDDGDDDEEAEAPLPPPPSQGNRRKRKERTPDGDEEQQQEQPNPKKSRQAIRSGTRSTSNQAQPVERKSNPRSTGSRRVKSMRAPIGTMTRTPPSPYPDPCSNCQRNRRICGSIRPCSQCIDNGELDCDGDIISHDYRSDTKSMTTPTGNRPGMRCYPTPNSGSYAGRPAQGFGSPTTGYFDPLDTEVYDDTTQPLGRLTDHQRQNMPNGTPAEVLEVSSETWRGGRQSASAEAARNSYYKDSDNMILEPNEFFNDAASGALESQSNGNASPTLAITPENAIDPALAPTGPSENPHLPSFADLRGTQAPQPPQQAQNPNNGGDSLRSPVHPFIRIVRVPSVNQFNFLLPCDEPIISKLRPNCGKVPTKPCDHVRHRFNVCQPCENEARLGDFGLNEEGFALRVTQQYMCRYCADTTKAQFNWDENSGVQGNQCLCVGQLRMAWLCGLHWDEAVGRVNARAHLYDEWRTRNDLYGGCPACNARRGDRSTGVWICGACGEKVVGP